MTASQDTAAQRGRVIQADGVNIYYEVNGAGEPLVLFHAGTLTGDMWQPYLAAFTEHHRVFTPDMRGHGRTDNPKGAMTYRQLADEMVTFMRVVGLRKPLIAGFSDGGQVALEIGMRYPDVARALIVGGAWFKFTAMYREWVRDALGDEDSPEVDTVRLAQNHPDWVACWSRSTGRTVGSRSWSTSRECGRHR